MDLITKTDNFISFLLSISTDPNTVLACFFLGLARILPIMVLAPFLGAKLLPRTVKVMFAVSILAIIFPQLLLQVKTPIPFNISFVAYMLKELFIGFILGFLVSIPFYIALGSGSLIDHIRGSASLQVTDPSLQTQTGPVGIFYNYILIAVFFLIGGPYYFINGLSQSYELLPVNKFLNPVFFQASALPFWKLIFGLLNHVLSMALQLGAPSIIGILMAEMFLGIANRLAPQVQIVFLGISLKSWVGLGLLAAAWFFILKQLGRETLNWMQLIETTIKQTVLR